VNVIEHLQRQAVIQRWPATHAGWHMLNAIRDRAGLWRAPAVDRPTLEHFGHATAGSCVCCKDGDFVVADR
jgi:hypothetical protein